MQIALDALSAHLQALGVGQRAWFWFCPGARGAPPLALAPFRGDPLMRMLKAGLVGVKVPAESRPIVGLCLVGEDGVPSFASPDASEEALEALAAWARAGAASTPALRRLYGARMLQVDRTFQILATHEDPALWEGLEPMTAPGTLAEAVAALEALTPGDQAWFWATTRGPTGAPFLLVQPVAEDGDISPLNRRIEGVLRRTPAPGRVARGLVTRGPDGAVAVRSQVPPRRLQRVLEALEGQEPRLKMLRVPAPKS